jgi:hypothetical protein
MSTDITRLPATPGGARVQRTIPAPFQRPSITVGGSAAARRTWTQVPAYQLREGDIIPGVGRLYRVEEHHQAPAFGSGLSTAQIVDQITWTVTVTGGLNNTRTYQGNESVYAFTANHEHRSSEEAG